MNGDAHRSLEIVLDRELDAARALGMTLDAERAALTGSSPDAVIEKARQKTELFNLIEDLEAERRQLCQAAKISLPPMHAGRPPLMTGVSDAIADRWRSLLELIAKCRIANEVNGYIVNARRGQLDQLFQVLRGGAPITYGPQGKTFAKSLRALARA